MCARVHVCMCLRVSCARAISLPFYVHQYASSYVQFADCHTTSCYGNGCLNGHQATFCIARRAAFVPHHTLQKGHMWWTHRFQSGKKKQLRRRKVRSAWRWKRQTWDESGSCVDVHTIFWHVAHDSTFTLNLINRLVSIEACSLIIRKADTSSVFLLLHISSELALPMDNNCCAIAIAYNFGRRPGHTSIVARPHDQHNWLDLPLRCLFWKEWTTHGDGMLTHAAGGFGIGCGVLHHFI